MIAFRLLLAAVVLFPVLSPPVHGQEAAPPRATAAEKAAPKAKAAAKEQEKRRKAAANAKKRAAALRAIMKKLEIGVGATIADIGAGDGRDCWVFADIVGEAGKVYAEEIDEDKIKTIKEEMEKRKLGQVEPVVGRGDDPCLPPASADAAFMHYVYHHFSQPQEMLAGLFRSLKPGGYLVISDRHLGAPRDWIAREARAEKHYWIAETIVVREAREAGFAFFDCVEECWPIEDQFVLVFQRPLKAADAGVDPDRPLRLDMKVAVASLLKADQTLGRPVFIALGESRQLIKPLLARADRPGLDVVLGEWATREDERPALPPGVLLSSVLTENGKVRLGEDPIDTVFFLDTYHLLFHQETLLAALHDQLSSDGRVYVLDRTASGELSRRQASHGRKIALETVKSEMNASGFKLLSREPAPAADRFVLVFGKAGSQ